MPRNNKEKYRASILSSVAATQEVTAQLVSILSQFRIEIESKFGADHILTQDFTNILIDIGTTNAVFDTIVAHLTSTARAKRPPTRKSIEQALTNWNQVVQKFKEIEESVDFEGMLRNATGRQLRDTPEEEALIERMMGLTENEAKKISNSTEDGVETEDIIERDPNKITSIPMLASINDRFVEAQRLLNQLDQKVPHVLEQYVSFLDSKKSRR